jgi:hypothetical protein
MDDKVKMQRALLDHLEQECEKIQRLMDELLKSMDTIPSEQRHGSAWEANTNRFLELVERSGDIARKLQLGGSDTHYSVVGIGDFYGNGTDDILFRNNSTGDTWIEAISNGAFASWQQVGGSNTGYAVVAVGDYFGNGTSDILFSFLPGR